MFKPKSGSVPGSILLIFLLLMTASAAPPETLGDTAVYTTYYPQVGMGTDASNLNLTTFLTLTNPTTETATVTPKFYKPNGISLTYDEVTLEPNQTRVVELAGTGSITVGQLRLLASHPRVGSSVRYSTIDQNTGKVIEEISVSSAIPSSRYLLPAEYSSTQRTAFAVGNTENLQQELTLTLYDEDGVNTDQATIGINANSHLALFLHEVEGFEWLTGTPFRGSVEAVASTACSFRFHSLGRSIKSDDLQGVLFIIIEVFAPSNVPAHVWLDWKRDGELIHSSREIEITAHALGFQVWDGYRPETGEVAPGRYEVVLRTDGQRVFGLARIDVCAK